MKRKVVIAVLAAALVVTAAVAVFVRQNQPSSGGKSPAPAHTSKTGSPVNIPAHYATTPERGSLKPTLSPEMFKGKTREAYRAVREIPDTIAQLPCYCYCDTGFGHESLQSCFVDDHAAHCGVCVDEALTAYKLQKEQGLTAPKIRERIVAEYSSL